MHRLTRRHCVRLPLMRMPHDILFAVFFYRITSTLQRGTTAILQSAVLHQFGLIELNVYVVPCMRTITGLLRHDICLETLTSRTSTL